MPAASPLPGSMGVLPGMQAMPQYAPAPPPAASGYYYVQAADGTPVMMTAQGPMPAPNMAYGMPPGGNYGGGGGYPTNGAANYPPPPGNGAYPPGM